MLGAERHGLPSPACLWSTTRFSGTGSSEPPRPATCGTPLLDTSSAGLPQSYPSKAGQTLASPLNLSVRPTRLSLTRDISPLRRENKEF